MSMNELAMTDREKLLPCPFCGGEAYLVTGAPEEWVRCMKCHASSDTDTRYEGAAVKWNRRKAAAPSPTSPEGQKP